ncbi:Tex-like protein [Desulfobulbus propionicus DSM 2032]|uniref:Tex-like protein n=1 Tax=Desulfobulbus propionicus (strain ATCC 33891 / DSM 2032 / VKM B-1956 / 1pr3) TaxID=577650 RepID=A0A7U4DNZ3_DESPD|nr:Tex family protein [Desulfobulbus propionicus]ADW17606.1 Tex-like protein [Desulfobulbus propionicus DSM 2032]
MHCYPKTIADELGIRPAQVETVAALLDDGATIPFIARYRKEATGCLDELQLAAIRDRRIELAEVDKRRSAILASLDERGILDAALRQAVNAAADLAALEDIYLPYRPKRRTRAQIAREKGLEPLAALLHGQKTQPIEVEAFVNPEQEVATVEEALSGARDIIAEWISEDAAIRARLRDIFRHKAVITSTVVKNQEESGATFRDYFQWREPVGKAAGHRLLAMFRGEQAKVLSLSFRPPENEALTILHRCVVRANGFAGQQVTLAVDDSYKRLLAPSLENELRTQLKKQADQEAIAVFADNLRELLLAPPLGQKRTMALDPGFRTGAKLVCLGEQGQLLDWTTIYPTLSRAQQEEAAQTVLRLCRRYRIEAIAIGNGTASRETEAFVRGLDLPSEVVVTLVDERGASVYSASEVARAEFPDHDITVRGAVSIGRRLQDPLAELVKLDPKAIGVGQYQHDVQQKALKQSLDDVVVSCVNRVGVEVNSASKELLAYVSGLGGTLAANILAYRREKGPFTDRRQLLHVPRLGRKAFEQCAGFLRIHDAANPLDRSGVHPERYGIVEQMARECGCTISALMEEEHRRQRIQLDRYVQDGIGLPTLEDILAELGKPGRDPRRSFAAFAFAPGIERLEDLREGMRLPGIVTNVTKFGAFVDIGVHQDGLVHISQLADRYVKDPAEVVKVRQQVQVRVLEVDVKRRRIGLSLRATPADLSSVTDSSRTNDNG